MRRESLHNRRFRVRQRHTWHESGDRPEAGEPLNHDALACVLRGVEHAPDAGRPVRKAEPRRHHADHQQWAIAGLEHLADRAPRIAEPIAGEIPIEQGRRRLGGGAIGLNEPTPPAGIDTEE